MAEFPSSKQLYAIYVYSLSFSANAVNYLMNILAHELGHASRREFADQEGLGQVQWGPRNPKSVMSYTFPLPYSHLTKSRSKSCMIIQETI